MFLIHYSHKIKTEVILENCDDTSHLTRWQQPIFPSRSWDSKLRRKRKYFQGVIRSSHHYALQIPNGFSWRLSTVRKHTQLYLVPVHSFCNLMCPFRILSLKRSPFPITSAKPGAFFFPFYQSHLYSKNIPNVLCQYHSPVSCLLFLYYLISSYHHTLSPLAIHLVNHSKATISVMAL